MKMENLLNKKTLIVILGPTASGKTAASIELSKYIDMEVISADSRQVYKYLDIGTAKPTKEELSSVPHHFIDIIEPDDYYSSGLFGSQAEITANNILSQNKLPVVVGGSGLYIKALCEGLFEEEVNENQQKIRADLEKKLIDEGIEELYDELRKVDEESAILYIDRNPRRIIRALEYYYVNGVPISEHHKTKEVKRDFNILYFGIHEEREKLYERINLRTEIMWKNGLPDETKKALDMGFSSHLNSLNTVGYKETIAFLNSTYSESEAIEKIKQNTRRYAKRQMTWFRRNQYIKWISGSPEKVAETIYKSISTFK